MLPTECKLCRVCGLWHERMYHLPKCNQIVEVLTTFWELASKCSQIGPLDEPLIMLGWMGSAFLPSALSALHIILWKFVILTLARMDIHGEKWDSKAIWNQTLYRTKVRFLAHAEGARRWALARWAKGEMVPDGVVARWNKQVGPIAYYDAQGCLIWKVPLTDQPRPA